MCVLGDKMKGGGKLCIRAAAGSPLTKVHVCYSLLPRIPYLQRVRSSIARMGVTSIDLLQLHWEPPPAATAAAAVAGSSKSSSSSKGQPPPGFVVAAKVLKQLQQEGLIKQLGVSNFDVPMLMALLDAGVKPVSNQVGSADASQL